MRIRHERRSAVLIRGGRFAISFRAFWTIAVALVLSAKSVFAVDGVIEINQACVLGEGCFSGDAVGFPVTISRSGSYRLTSNLDVPDVDTSAILVATPDVRLDLNGFSIRCAGCSGAGSGFGIDADATSNNLHVQNGTIASVGSGGFRSMASRANVRDMLFFDVGGTAVFQVGFDARIEDCTIVSPGGSGIVLGMWGVVVGNHLRGAGSVGIEAADGRIEGNLVANSGTDGIRAFDAIVIRNRVSSSGEDGIDCGGCTVRDNDVSGNAGLGLAASLFSSRPTAYGGNRFFANNGGNANPQVNSTAIETSGNVCGVDAACP